MAGDTGFDTASFPSRVFRAVAGERVEEGDAVVVDGRFRGDLPLVRPATPAAAISTKSLGFAVDAAEIGDDLAVRIPPCVVASKAIGNAPVGATVFLTGEPGVVSVVGPPNNLLIQVGVVVSPGKFLASPVGIGGDTSSGTDVDEGLTQRARGILDALGEVEEERLEAAEIAEAARGGTSIVTGYEIGLATWPPRRRETDAQADRADGLTAARARVQNTSKSVSPPRRLADSLRPPVRKIIVVKP